MKTLMLLRHAKSSWKDDSLTDHERPLNKRGRRSAPLVGELIKRLDLVPDGVLSSTAVRARTTAEAVAEASGFAGEMAFLDELYLATAGELLRIAQTHGSEEHPRIMLVAHNPGMEDLFGRLSGRREPFPTAALAAFEVGIDSWRALELGVETTLIDVWRPRELE